MATASGVRAGKAYVEIHGKDDGLKKTLQSDEAAMKKTMEAGLRLSESVATTQQKYNAKLERYDHLLKAGAISQTTYNRAVAAAKKEFDITSVASKAIAVVGRINAALSAFAMKTAIGAAGVTTAFFAAAKSFADNADTLSRLKGTGIGAEEVRQANALKVAFSTVSTSIQAAWANIGAAVAPVLTKVLNGISVVVQGVTKWLAANRPLVATIAMFVAKVAVAAAAIFVLTKAMIVLAPVLALIMNPIGGLIALLAIGVAAWAAWSSSGQAAVGYARSYVGNTIAWLQERFGQLFKDFKVAWDGIVAAVSKGDLATAAEIAWVSLKLTFFEAIKAMGGNWNTFYTTYLQTITLIGDAWDVLWTRVKQGWRNLQNILAKGIAIVLGVVEGKSAEERQQVLDELDAMAAEDNKATESKLQGRILDRQKTLTDALAALPASDQARINALRQQLAALAETAKEGSVNTPEFYAPKNIATAGTFNAAAIRSVAGGGAIDQIAQNTKKTAENTKDLVNKKPAGPVFAGGK